jgi:hypothetical protein
MPCVSFDSVAVANNRVSRELCGFEVGPVDRRLLGGACLVFQAFWTCLNSERGFRSVYRLVAIYTTSFIVCVTFLFACCLPVVELGVQTS